MNQKLGFKADTWQLQWMNFDIDLEVRHICSVKQMTNEMP